MSRPGVVKSLSGALTFDLLRLGLGWLPPDLDPAWPHDLRYLAHQVDGQQPVCQVGVGDLDVVSELETLLERAGPDAAV